MLQKTKLFAVMGVALIVQAVSCFIIFCATLEEKKSLASAFWAMCLSFAAAGAALLALYSKEEEKRIALMRKRISDRDHWFHSFEYPECHNPHLTIDDTYIPPVETEE